MVTVKIEQDVNGDLILPLGEDTCNELGWEVGDTIFWEDNGDGSFVLSKKPKTKIVLVDCVSSFRMRYAVEVPADAPDEWALDTVVCGEAEEFSQEHIGEDIVSHRVIDQEEFLRVYRQDNPYVNGKYGDPWSDEVCLRNGLTKWEPKE